MLRKLAAIGLLCLAVAGATIASAAFKPAAEPSGPIKTIALPDTVINAAVQTTYQIQNGSSASFSIDEILAGSPNTVVGTTALVSGQIAVNAADPERAQVGTILIDARALLTDDNQRNRMIGNVILSTAQYEYITFSPTSVSGLSQTISVGAPYTFQIDGSLTIKDVTLPATFIATVTPTSSNELRGTASTTIRYADWGINIPKVPLVASVDDTVQLQIDFVAAA